MRIGDLDRDMIDVIPTGTSLDSEFLFARMAEVTLASLRCARGALVLDAAAGIGQDDWSLAERGVRAVGAEPSGRMTALARLRDAEVHEPPPGRVVRVRAWSEALPFRADSFDGAFCKGSLDHFDDPLASIRELARATRPGGRVVLAIANFDSLGCRLLRLRAALDAGAARRGRRHFDVPSDHYTRYDPALICEQVGRHVTIEECTGVSLLWGVRPWARLLTWLRPGGAHLLLRLADRLARLAPWLADVIVVAGPPRR